MVKIEIPDVIVIALLSTIEPENVKLDAPFAVFPLVTIYETSTVLPFSGFFPNKLSPKRIWYFSSLTS